MKRFVAVIALPIMALVILGIIFASQSWYTPHQVALSNYLAARGRPGTTVKAMVQASQPSNFSREMSGAIVGDSVYYQVSQQDAFSLVATPGGIGQPSSKRPLPFPPETLWCVLLGSSQGDAVVFVALHRDMYNAQWLAHEAKNAWQGDELKAQLGAIGCEFEIEESQ